MNGSTSTVALNSDLMQPDFLAASKGHRMENCGVVTSGTQLMTESFSYNVLTACVVY